MSLLRKLLVQNGENDYIRFEDPTVARICAETWGDGIGLTYQQAKSVKTLGKTFKDNTEITTFDELQYFGIVTLGNQCFSGCTNLSKIALPPNLTIIPAYSFDKCSHLEKVSNLNNISSISDFAFRYCGLEEISFHNLISIGDGSLARMTKVKSINIPKIKNLASYNFCYNSLMENILFDQENATTIPAEAFSYCSSLKMELYFPNLVSVNYDAFYQCVNISGSLSLPKLTSLGDRAFARTGIEKITDIGSISTIPAYCFAILPNLTFCKIPDTVNYINAGFMDNCPNLTTLILSPTTPPTITNSAEMLKNHSAELKIFVPDDSIESYKTADIWIKWSDYYYPISEYVD